MNRREFAKRIGVLCGVSFLTPKLRSSDPSDPASSAKVYLQRVYRNAVEGLPIERWPRKVWVSQEFWDRLQSELKTNSRFIAGYAALEQPVMDRHLNIQSYEVRVGSHLRGNDMALG